VVRGHLRRHSGSRGPRRDPDRRPHGLLVHLQAHIYGNCPDRGRGGVDTDVLALGFNVFSGIGCTGGFLGAGLQWLNKSEMIIGATAHFCNRSPDPTYFSLLPAQALSSGQTTEYFASNDDTSTSKLLHRATSVGVPTASTCPTFTALPDITLAHTYPTSPKTKQPGTTAKLETDDQRVQHVVWKSGVSLLMTWTEKCTPAGDTKARSCARVIVTTDAGAVSMDTELSKKKKYYFYPAATLNSANDVVVTFGICSSDHLSGVGRGGGHGGRRVHEAPGPDHGDQPEHHRPLR